MIATYPTTVARSPAGAVKANGTHRRPTSPVARLRKRKTSVVGSWLPASSAAMSTGVSRRRKRSSCRAERAGSFSGKSRLRKKTATEEGTTVSTFVTSPQPRTKVPRTPTARATAKEARPDQLGVRLTTRPRRAGGP